MENKLYYILCLRHSSLQDYTMTWWGPNSSGYTLNLNKAGKYTEKDIERFKGYERQDLPILCEEIDSMAKELEYNWDGWELGRFVLNDELFWNTYNINAKKLFYKGRSNKRLFRYPKKENS